MNSIRFCFGAAVCLVISACVSPSRPAGSVTGETSGTLTRLALSADDKNAVEAGADAYIKPYIGSSNRGSSGRGDGDFATTSFYLTDYRRVGEPRSMRGSTEDVVILPFAAKINTTAGGAELRSYFLATRERGTALWTYREGSDTDLAALYRRFPGLKETNAVPPVKASLASLHPSLH